MRGDAWTDQGPKETELLRRLLVVLIPVAIAFALAGTSGWVANGNVESGMIGVIMTSATCLGLLAWWFTRRGRVVAAVSTITLTALGIAIAEAGVPPATPGLAALPLVAAGVALQFVSGWTLRRLLVLCWGATIAVAVIVELVPTSAMPGIGDPIRRVSTIVGIVGVTMVLLEQFATRLRESLAIAKEAGEALAASEARQRAVVEEIDEVVFRLDADARWTLLNPAWSRITGLPAGDSLGRPAWEFFAAPDRDAVRIRLEALIAGSDDSFAETARLDAADGGERWIEIRARRATGDRGDLGAVSGTLSDITAQRRLAEELTELAFHDPLTGLANRALFHDRVDHLLALRRRSPHPSAVVFLDLDAFKVINDSLGHAAGDRLLAEVAKRLEAAVRTGDTIGRLGGDEFGVLLEEVADAEDALHIAERIVEVVRAPVDIEGREIAATGSAGVVILDGRPTTVDEVLRNADVAMYEAKGYRDGRVALFEPAMHRAAVGRLQDLAELRNAVEREEFFLEYQPIVDLQSGAMIGVEALVRWRHPDRGTVPPGSFIPLAETSGLVVPLGRWVAREACRQLVAWQGLMPGRHGLSMNVNLSPVQLGHADLVSDIAAILDETGVEPGRLVFEITETAVMRDPEAAERRIRLLRSMGVRVAIDDFGAGTSSLGFIRHLPVDILKLDRSLIAGLDRDASSAAMADLFVRLGTLLDMETVAEGIETPGEAEVVRALNCRLAQGFHYSHPVEPASIGALLRAGTRWGPAASSGEGADLERAG